MKKLILASSSPYRKNLLNTLGLNFECHSPDINESQLDNETPNDLVSRLSVSKCLEIAKSHPNAIIIGSDEVASCETTILGKPGSHANAIKQITQISGKWLSFHTGICVMDSESKRYSTDVVIGKVAVKSLTSAEIESYLQKAKPYSSAASFHFEGLGTALITEYQGSDPSSIIGLPMIKLCSLLENFGISVLGNL